MNNISIAILCVNYNSYESLINYLFSLDNAINQCIKNRLIVDVFVADNSIDKERINIQTLKYINVKIFFYEKNNGYIGGIIKLMEEDCVDISIYRYVIISNVDLQVSSDFFEKLSDKQFADNVGWIAPRIFSSKENRDRNPKILRRPTLKRMQGLKLTYKYPFLHRIYEYTFYRIKNKKIDSSFSMKYMQGMVLL